MTYELRRNAEFKSKYNFMVYIFVNSMIFTIILFITTRAYFKHLLHVVPAYHSLDLLFKIIMEIQV